MKPEISLKEFIEKFAPEGFELLPAQIEMIERARRGERFVFTGNRYGNATAKRLFDKFKRLKLMNEIKKFLDANGFGVMTDELQQIFVAGGCEPHCHICNVAIEPPKLFHLKTFGFRVSKEKFLGSEFHKVDEYSNYTASVQVMICNLCSDENKPLPPEQQNFVESLLDYHEPELLPADTRAPKRPPASGCFLLSVGDEEKIIPNAEN